MTVQDKAIKLVTKLIRLTIDDKLEWAIEDPPRSITRGTDDVIPLFYKAKYRDKYVAIYQQRYRDFDLDADSPCWREKLVFTILDDQDRVLWEDSGRDLALIVLLDTVRRKFADIDELLDDLLDDKENLTSAPVHS